MTPKLVFVSSCCSEDSGNFFVKAGVPHVVAVKKGQSVSGEFLLLRLRLLLLLMWLL